MNDSRVHCTKALGGVGGGKDMPHPSSFNLISTLVSEMLGLVGIR